MHDTTPDLSTATTSLGTVEYHDTGGDGPVVLFVHGTPGGADQGALMGAFLAERGARVLAPSRPGYLGTPLSPTVASPTQQAALHVALLDTLGVEQVALACWSGGGPSSYQLALQHPARVRSMAAIAAVSGTYRFEHPSEETILFGRPGAWLMAQMARHAPHATVKALVTEEGDLPKDQARDLVDAIWSDDATRQWVLDWAGTVTGSRRSGFDNDRAHLADLALDLGSLSMPLLLVHADTDADVPIEHSQRAAEQVPGAELLTVSGGTHISAWTGPDQGATQDRIAAHLLGG
jgi:pimeloyl-ACP methyl ester carboxylesterase